jgi:hypothetical protein
MNTPTVARDVIAELETRVVIGVCRVWPRGDRPETDYYADVTGGGCVYFTGSKNFPEGVKYFDRAEGRRFALTENQVSGYDLLLFSNLLSQIVNARGSIVR